MVCVWGGAFANHKVGELHQVKGKLNHTGYHSILQYHAIPSGTQLVGQGFVLMQDNDQKFTSKLCQRYIKSKEEQHIIQLKSRLVQSLNWCGMNLTEKLELNNLQMWLSSSITCRKAGQNYLLSTSSLKWKEY